MAELHSLNEYIAALEQNGIQVSVCGNADTAAKIAYVTFDSRECRPGTLFVCKGAAFKDIYLDRAFEAGAAFYIAEKEYPEKPGLAVSDIRRAMAVLADVFYESPYKSFPLVGITGSKGKSTTLYYVLNIAEKYCGAKGLNPMGFLSTIDTFDGIEHFESHLTTPEALVLFHHFDNARKAKLWAMGMEVSSQALKYDRTYGVMFDIGVFTNFGSDHIGEGEHTDIEDYFSSKLRLMRQCRTAVINADSDRAEEIIAAAEASPCCRKVLTYSAGGNTAADYYAENIRKEHAEIAFTIHAPKGIAGTPSGFSGELRLTMPGLFNAENALCAAVICAELGVPYEYIESGLYDAKAAGRMEFFENKERDVICLVDYAHSILSFEKLFSSVKQEFPGYRIEALFGCPGGKGLQRRWDLPSTAAKYADYCWITEEDPGLEDADEICRVVLENLLKCGGKGSIVVNREDAVRTAVLNAAPKTVIVLTGKGREEYMHRGNDYVPMESEVSMVERYLGLK